MVLLRKKILVYGNQAILVQKIIHLFNSASVLGFFVFILCSERGLEVHENRVLKMVFPKIENGLENGLSKIGHILS